MLSITVGWYTSFPPAHVLALEGFQCIADMTRDQQSMYIPTVAFCHFDSSTLHPVHHNVFPLFSLICQSAGMQTINGGSEDDNGKLDDSNVPPVVCRQCL